jgi:hypothetical protein
MNNAADPSLFKLEAAGDGFTSGMDVKASQPAVNYRLETAPLIIPEHTQPDDIAHVLK